ncbi:MAG: sensor histidine kinase [Flavobacteriales bacterium]
MRRRPRILDIHNDYWLRVIVVPFMGLLLPYFTDLFPESPYNENFLSEYPYFFTIFFSVIFFESNRLSFKLLKKVLKIQFDISVNIIFRTIVQLGLTLFLLVFSLLFWFEIVLETTNYTKIMFDNIKIGLVITFIFLLLYQASYFLHKWSQLITKAEKLEVVNTEIQISNLKNQLAPHFLFNSLGTLMSLVESDKEKALEFISSFSNMYRYILEHDEDICVDLKEELLLIDDFIKIAKANYGDLSIIYTKSVSRLYANYKLPKLSIQMLVENALKHNIHTTRKPLTIEISINEESNRLVVKNNIQLRKSQAHSTGTGLNNINERYKKMGEKGIEIITSDEFYEVHLPLINEYIEHKKIS